MSGHDPAVGQYRDHPTQGLQPDYELRDYYDDTDIPPPHRLSAYGSPYPSSHNLASQPDTSFQPQDTRTRGAYAAPGDAAASGMPYQSHAPLEQGDPGTSAWLQYQTKRSKRAKWLIVGAIVAVIGIIAVGVGVGVSLAHKKSGGSSSSKSSSNGAVKQTDPNNPSTFVKDSRLKKSFYGLAYTPAGSQLPQCGNSLSDVIQDIQLMSQLTSRLRLYGADCNQTALVLEAIKQTKVDMKVYLGNYPIATDSNAAYDRQRDLLKTALQTYGTEHVIGVTVGNEFMLNYLNANGAADPNSATGNTGAQLLLADITDMRTTLSGLSLPATLTVGTSDAGSYFNTQVLQGVDYGMSNVHPWFANQSIDAAAGWTAGFFAETNVAPAALLSNNPKMFIAETGWPTRSLDVGNESNGPSVASEANLQKYLDTFVCQANTNGTGYFYFEMFDEPWKDTQFGGVEGYWGMFYANKTMKALTMPDCVLSS